MRNRIDPKSSEYVDIVCNCTAVRQAARRLTRFYDARLAEVGLRGTQYIILLHLSRRGPSSIAELAEELVMDRTTLNHNLKPLEREGFIRLVVAAEDRRSRIVELAASGRTKVEDGRSAWIEAQEVFEREFGSADARDLRRVMGRIANMRLSDDPESA